MFHASVGGKIKRRSAQVDTHAPLAVFNINAGVKEGHILTLLHERYKVYKVLRQVSVI